MNNFETPLGGQQDLEKQAGNKPHLRLVPNTQTEDLPIKNPDLPAIEFTVDGVPSKEEERLEKVEARLEEVAMRQKELANDQNTASMEEKAELEKETLSLKEELEKNAGVSPLQTSYDRAMDRLWKENKKKRESGEMPLATKPAENQPESNNKETLASEKLPEIEKVRPVLSPEQISGLVAKNTETRERAIKSKTERLNAFTRKEETAVEADAEKVGVLDVVRKMGTAYNKMPLKKKLLISAALILTASGMAATGGVAGGAIATAAFTGSVIQRLFGGAATFVTAEGLLKASAEKDGRERSDAEKMRHTAEALIAGVLVGSGALSHAIGNIYHHFIPEVAPQGVIHAPTVAPNPKIDFVVEKGGTLWGGIETKLNAQGLFSGMGVGQKTYVLDALKDKFAAMSPDELKAIGFSSGNIDLINPGDHIDLTKVLGDTQLLPNVLHSAEILSPDQVASIEHPVGAHHIITPPETTPNSPYILHAINNPVDSAPHFTADSPEVVSAVNQGTENFVNKVPGLGTKGIFGFLSEKGVDSLNWKYLATEPVEKILAAHPTAFTEGGGATFGLDNYYATTEVQKALGDLVKETGINFNPSEQAQSYIKRVVESGVLKNMNNG